MRCVNVITSVIEKLIIPCLLTTVDNKPANAFIVKNSFELMDDDYNYERKVRIRGEEVCKYVINDKTGIVKDIELNNVLFKNPEKAKERLEKKFLGKVEPELKDANVNT